MYAVVAIPSQDDYVWNLSSEKVPHMTICAFEDPGWSAEQLSHVLEYTEHAASLLNRFGMSVDHRGELGEKKADVLFFDTSWKYKIETFRSNILADPLINAAVHGDDHQFDKWVMHLTMGFPESPAKKDTRDYPGTSWVNFDRIAFWTGEYSGPTFRLGSEDRGLAEVAYMSEHDYAADVLEHYGVKGMKWGVRRKSRQVEPSSDESRATSKSLGRAKKNKTTRVLTNAELRQAIERMRLEQEFSKLSGGVDKTFIQKGAGFASKILTDAGKQSVQQVANNQAKKQVDGLLK